MYSRSDTDDQWFSELPKSRHCSYAYGNPEGSIYLYRAFRQNQVQVRGRGSVAETTVLRRIAHTLNIPIHKSSDLQVFRLQADEVQNRIIARALKDAGFKRTLWEDTPVMRERSQGQHHFRTARIKKWSDVRRPETTS